MSIANPRVKLEGTEGRGAHAGRPRVVIVRLHAPHPCTHVYTRAHTYDYTRAHAYDHTHAYTCVYTRM